jgi:hypothetical protein
VRNTCCKGQGKDYDPVGVGDNCNKTEVPLKDMKTSLLAAVACTAMAATAPAAIIIDSFDTAQSVLVNGAPSGSKYSAGSQSAAEVLGGERDIEAQRDSGSGFVRANSNTDFANQFSLSTSSPGRVRMVYDGADSSDVENFTGMNTDITQGGANTTVRLTATSDVATKIYMWVYSDATHGSQYIFDIPADGSFSMSDYDVPLSSFTPIVGGGADFTQVGLIGLDFLNSSSGSLPAGSNTAVDLLEVFGPASPVPEAHHYALFAGLACMGLVGFRHYRARTVQA